jgi:NADPH:quinone reductase-like Zn-dependent oxidoreductase
MKALCWHGKGDVRVDSVPDPKIEQPRDAIVRITTTAICGSDLHLLDGYVPTMEKGDVLGHEFMGEVVEVGAECRGKLNVGQRVVIPFTIACGECSLPIVFLSLKRSMPTRPSEIKRWLHQSCVETELTLNFFGETYVHETEKD